MKKSTSHSLIFVCSAVLVLGIAAVIVAMLSPAPASDGRSVARDHAREPLEDNRGPATEIDDADLLSGDDNDAAQRPTPDPLDPADNGGEPMPVLPDPNLPTLEETVIAGRVISAETGEPIEGALVRVHGGYTSMPGNGFRGEEGQWGAIPFSGGQGRRAQVDSTQEELEALQLALEKLKAKAEAEQHAQQLRDLQRQLRDRNAEERPHQEQPRPLGVYPDGASSRPQGGALQSEVAVSEKTGADGRFRVVVPEGGGWQVVVTAPDCAMASRQVVVATGQTADIEVQLNAGFALHGVVRTESGPLAGVHVAAFGWPPGPNNTAGTAVSTDDGSYRIEGLSAGEYRVNVGAPGYYTFQEAVSVNGPTEYDIVLERGAVVSIRCTMQDGGAMLTTLMAAMVRKPSSGPLPTRELGSIDGKPIVITLGSTMHQQQVDANGLIEIGGVAPGDYDVTVYDMAANGIIPWKSSVSVVENGRHSLDATIDPGVRVSVRVVDEAGDGVPQAAVTLYVPNRYGDSDSRYATTDESGNAEVSGLTARQYAVLVIKAGYANTESAFDARSGNGELQLVLERGNVLTGTVTGPTGAPIPNGAIYLTGNESVRHGGHHAGQIDADGIYRIEGVEVGTWLVTITAQGVVPSAEPITVTIVKGENRFDIELGRNGNTLRGVVTMPDGSPAANASVTVQVQQSPGGSERGGRQTQFGQAAQTMTAEDGSWLIYGLPDADVVINAMMQQRSTEPLFRDDESNGTARGYALTLSAFDSLTVVSNSTCNLRLVQPGILSGVIIDATTGEPATNCYARLEAVAPSNPYDYYGRAGQNLVGNTDGKFAFAAAPGEWTLVVTRGSGMYDEYRESVRVPTRDIVIHLPAPPSYYTISGTLLDQNNDPIVGAYLLMESADDKNPNRKNMRPQSATDADGNFKVENVREGSWRVSATLRSGKRIEPGWDLIVVSDISGLILTGNMPPSGFQVMAVGADSNAANAGMQVGDIIIEYNGVTIAGRDTLVSAIREAEQAGQGGTIAVQVYRDGSYTTLYVNPGYLGISGY